MLYCGAWHLIYHQGLHRIPRCRSVSSSSKTSKTRRSGGFHCLTILVNGANRFTVKNPDRTERETWFNKPPEAGNSKLEDLDQIIKSKVRE